MRPTRLLIAWLVMSRLLRDRQTSLPPESLRFAGPWMGATAITLGAGLFGLWLANALGAPALNDWEVLRRSGQDLLSGELQVYVSDPRLNVGPLALLAAGLIPSRAMAAMVGAALLPVTVMSAMRKPLIELRAYVAVTLALLPWTVAGLYGHIDDQLALFLLVASCAFQGTGRGAIIGLAIVAKPWALCGLGILRAREWIGAILIVAVVTLPFLLDGSLAGAGHFSVGVQDGAPVSLVTDSLPNWWRFPQLAAMLAIVFLLRRHPLAALTAGLTIRLLLDPGDFPYYTAAIAGLGACLAATSCNWWPLIASWPLLLSPAFPAEPVVRTLALLIACVASVRCARTKQPQGPGDRTHPRGEPTRLRRQTANTGEDPRREFAWNRLRRLWRYPKPSAIVAVKP